MFSKCRVHGAPTRTLIPYKSLNRFVLSSYLSSSSSIQDGSDAVPCSKLQLLEDQGFTSRQISALQAGPNSRHFLAVPHSKLESLLLLLKKHGVSGAEAGRLLAQCPNVLRLGLDNVEAKIDFFGHRLGTRDEPRLLAKLITYYSGNQSLLSLSLQNLERHLTFLKEELDMDASDACKIVTSLPSFFTLNVERNLSPKVKFFKDRGLHTKDIAFLWKSYPRLLQSSENPGIVNRIDLLKHFGMELNSRAGLTALGYWSSRSPQTLLVRFDAIKRHGIPHLDAVRMVQMHPNLLCCTEESISEKLDYLFNVLGLDVEELMKFPTYLTYSLHKRIVPRFTVIKELKRYGLLKKDYSLSLVLHLTNENFSKRFDALRDSLNNVDNKDVSVDSCNAVNDNDALRDNLNAANDNDNNVLRESHNKACAYDAFKDRINNSNESDTVRDSLNVAYTNEVLMDSLNSVNDNVALQL